MIYLSILHYPKHRAPEVAANLLSFGGEFPVFDTCQRKIWINPESKADLRQALPGAELFLDAEAYRFLLEVICGLHSRVFGETEILGQFRTFFRDNPGLSTIGNWLLEDAKTIRSTHLRDLGAQSYGSVVRRWCSPFPSVAILGTGQLAKKLLPWLPHALLIRSRGLSSLPTTSAVIIAAPIEDSVLDQLQNGQFWIDLRAERAHFRSSLNLEHLFSEIERDSQQHREIRLVVQDSIRKIADARFNRLWCRPQGWEDLA